MPYSAWATQRTNLSLRPNSDGNAPTGGVGWMWAARWGGNGGTAGSSTVTGASDGPLAAITSYARKTWTVIGNAYNDISFNLNRGGRIPVTPGQQIMVSFWWRNSWGAAGARNRITATFYNVATGGTGSAIASGNFSYPSANAWQQMFYTFTVPTGMTYLDIYHEMFSDGKAPVVGSTLDVTGMLVELSSSLGTFFWAGGAAYTDTAVPSLFQTIWAGTVENSASYYQTRTYSQPGQADSVIPIKNLSTSEVLYGDRTTSYRYEVLEHSNGVDNLVGTLDGVSDGSLSWTNNAAVKGTGKISVLDLETAQAGMLRVAQLKLASVRIRPVQSVSGLPENPLGTFLVENATEEWDDTGRVWNISLFDRCTVPQQDKYENSYAVPAGALILQTIKTILASCGEYIEINASSTLATSTGMVWEAGTSKLKIINDLLDAAGYNALWMDGYGNFQVTPRVLPADRAITYEVLGIPRELRDGEQGIYRPDWSRERDTFEVPNKVIAVEAAGGEDAPAIVGTWTNEDASSPFSYQARGRWIPHVLDSVEVPAGTPAERLAFLQSRARATLVQMSAVQAQAKVEHLPIPVRVSDVLRFANKRAGVDSRHVITNLSLDLSSTGLMKSTLQEVVSL